MRNDVIANKIAHYFFLQQLATYIFSPVVMIAVGFSWSRFKLSLNIRTILKYLWLVQVGYLSWNKWAICGCMSTIRY